jgi:hypothetical protein
LSWVGLGLVCGGSVPNGRLGDAKNGAGDKTEGAPLWAHNIIAQVVCDGHDSGVERREAVGARSAVHEMGGGPVPERGK